MMLNLCSKTSLRLAASRLKLLKNKKEVQVNQMKREIAQLLETGQDQTAKIRVIISVSYDLLECVANFGLVARDLQFVVLILR